MSESRYPVTKVAISVPKTARDRIVLAEEIGKPTTTVKWQLENKVQNDVRKVRKEFARFH